MEYQLSAKIREGKLLFDNPDHFDRAKKENEGNDVIVSIKPLNKVSKKQRMYNYLHAVIIPLVVQILTNDGFEQCDEAFAENYLKLNCAKATMYNTKTDTEETYLLEKKAMSIDRLYKFVQDSIHLIETRHFPAKVPDSQEYKDKSK